MCSRLCDGSMMQRLAVQLQFKLRMPPLQSGGSLQHKPRYHNCLHVGGQAPPLPLSALVHLRWSCTLRPGGLQSLSCVRSTPGASDAHSAQAVLPRVPQAAYFPRHDFLSDK